MKAVVGGSIQRIAITAAAIAASHPKNSRPAPRSRRYARLRRRFGMCSEPDSDQAFGSTALARNTTTGSTGTSS